MRDDILRLIEQTDARNGGRALGWERFEKKAGIGYHACFGTEQP